MAVVGGVGAARVAPAVGFVDRHAGALGTHFDKQSIKTTERPCSGYGLVQNPHVAPYLAAAGQGFYGDTKRGDKGKQPFRRDTDDSDAVEALPADAAVSGVRVGGELTAVQQIEKIRPRRSC